MLELKLTDRQVESLARTCDACLKTAGIRGLDDVNVVWGVLTEALRKREEAKAAEAVDEAKGE